MIKFFSATRRTLGFLSNLGLLALRPALSSSLPFCLTFPLSASWQKTFQKVQYDVTEDGCWIMVDVSELWKDSYAVGSILRKE